MKAVADRLMPKKTRRMLARWAVALTRHPRVGRIDFGDFRRLKPISSTWGFDRGTPIDRFYIDRFMQAHAHDVRGRWQLVRVAQYRPGSITVRTIGCQP